MNKVNFSLMALLAFNGIILPGQGASKAIADNPGGAAALAVTGTAMVGLQVGITVMQESEKKKEAKRVRGQDHITLYSDPQNAPKMEFSTFLHNEKQSTVRVGGYTVRYTYNNLNEYKKRDGKYVFEIREIIPEPNKPEDRKAVINLANMRIIADMKKKEDNKNETF